MSLLGLHAKAIIYSVGQFTSIQETFKPLVKRLRKEKCAFPRMTIYGQSFGVCADVFRRVR